VKQRDVILTERETNTTVALGVGGNNLRRHPEEVAHLRDRLEGWPQAPRLFPSFETVVLWR
jgi:hypothetical protein